MNIALIAIIFRPIVIENIIAIKRIALIDKFFNLFLLTRIVKIMPFSNKKKM